MTSGFAVAAAELLTAGARLADASDVARSRVSALDDDVAELFAVGWRGAAADGFAHGWACWREGAEEVVDALAEIGHLLTDNGRHYENTETATADIVRQAR